MISGYNIPLSLACKNKLFKTSIFMNIWDQSHTFKEFSSPPLLKISLYKLPEM